MSTGDAFAKNRHSRLSGIVLLHDNVKKKDSGQAGMTSKDGFSTYCEAITFKLPGILGLIVVVTFIAGTAFSNPNLGRDVTPEEIAAWDISISPDGSGLPLGSGTAIEGGVVYNAKCAGCHGVKGIKKPADPLVGGTGTLASKKPVRTVGSYWPYATTLFDYIRRAMPFNAPQSLSNDEVYALSAYLLFLNDVIGPEARMDARTLPQVKMPNRDGFVGYWP
jgi:cytochrome c